MAGENEEAGLIEKILTDAAAGKQITIPPGALSPQGMKILTGKLNAGASEPSLIDEAKNVVTGDLESMPYDDLDFGDAAKDYSGQWNKALKNGAPGSPEAAAYAKAIMAPDAPSMISSGYHSSATPEGKLKILSRVNPELAKTAQKDPWGNFYVMGKDGKRKYINRPGLSSEDWSEGLHQTINSGPLLALSATIPEANLLTRLGLGSLSGGAGSILNDKVAQAAGSGEEPSPGRAVASAIAGFGGEALMPIASKIGTTLYRAFKTPRYITRAGELNPNGIKLLAEAGVDWEGMSEAARKGLQDRIKRAQSPLEAVTAIVQEDLPGGPIRLTEAQLKGSEALYNDEKLLRTGAQGDAAADAMKNFDALQNTDIKRNVNAVVKSINPETAQQTAWGQGGAQATEELRRKELAAAGGADKAFELARDPSGNAFLPDIGELTNKIKNDRDLAILAENNPTLKTALAEFDKRFVPKNVGTDKRAGTDVIEKINEKRVADGSAPLDIALTKDVPAGNSSASIPEMFDYMKLLNKMQNQVDFNSGHPVRELRRKISDYLQDDAVQQLVQGDPAAIKNFMTANKTYKEYKDLFSADDIIERLTQRKPGSNLKKPQYTMNVEDASKIIFGASELGMINRSGAAESFRKLKKMLPENEWNSLREEAFLRMTGWGPEDFANPAKLTPSAAKLRTNLANFEKKNAPLLDVLFDKKELGMIRNFTNVYAKATLAPQVRHRVGSDTAPLLSRLVQQIGKSIGGPKVNATLNLVAGRFFLPQWQKSVRKSAADRATGNLSGAIPKLLEYTMPGGVGAAAALPAAGSIYDSMVSKYDTPTE